MCFLIVPTRDKSFPCTMYEALVVKRMNAPFLITMVAGTELPYRIGRQYKEGGALLPTLAVIRCTPGHTAINILPNGENQLTLVGSAYIKIS